MPAASPARPPSSPPPRQGIGRATALAFAAEGARVIATDLNEAQARRARRRRHPTHASSTSPTPAAVEAAIRAPAPSTCCSTAPASCTRAPSWTPPRRTGTSPSTLNVRRMCRTIRAVLPAHAGEPAAASIINMSSRRRQREGRAEPLRLRRHQGGGDRADQVGRRRLRHARHPLQRDLPRHGRDAEPRATASPRMRAGRRASSGRARRSSRASRWGGSARRRKSRRSRSISRATSGLRHRPGHRDRRRLDDCDTGRGQP